MFIKIEYQCYDADKNKGMINEDLKSFIKKMDNVFAVALAEKGYAFESSNYNLGTGVRELFFVKVVSA